MNMRIEWRIAIAVVAVLVVLPVSVAAVQSGRNRLPDDRPAYAAWVAFRSDPRAAGIAGLVAAGDEAALTELADSGDPEGQAALGSLLCATGRFEESRARFAAAAAEGHPSSLAYAIVLAAPSPTLRADPALAALSFRRMVALRAHAAASGGPLPPDIETALASPCVSATQARITRDFVRMVSDGRLSGLHEFFDRTAEGDGVARDPVEAYGIGLALERFMNFDSGPRFPSTRSDAMAAQLDAAGIAEGRRRADAWSEVTRGRL
ncbi:MAG: hypothetical protein IT534_13250 [Bauldia sp.]|nr:hypothetical protein [Bauldia sp.]